MSMCPRLSKIKRTRTKIMETNAFIFQLTSSLVYLSIYLSTFPCKLVIHSLLMLHHGNMVVSVFLYKMHFLCIIMYYIGIIDKLYAIWRVSSQNRLNPFWSISDIWDLSCWNIKKIKFVILLIITSDIYTFMYNELGIIRKALFCIIR